MLIKKASIAHLSEIEHLNKKYFKEVRDFRKIIEGENDLFFVVIDNGKVVGFSGFHIFNWNNTARVIDIFVHPRYRRRGLASKILTRLKKEAKKIGSRTMIAEAPSLNGVLNLYLKSGFRICGFNDRYYSNDGKEVAVFLSYDLI